MQKQGSLGDGPKAQSHERSWGGAWAEKGLDGSRAASRRAGQKHCAVPIAHAPPTHSLSSEQQARPDVLLLLSRPPVSKGQGAER